MIRSALVAVLAALVLPMSPRAAEPYRPLPRLPSAEVDRRAEGQPVVVVPPATAAPAGPGVAAAATAAPAQDAQDEAPAPPGQQKEARGSRAPTLETFRAALSPFGTWERWTKQGWVWRPDVAADWRPYHDGQWIWTERGWSWSSNEPWGWATYHYGRWSFDASEGWAWIPGQEWAPAWVAWRFDPDVVGWAPLFAESKGWAVEHASARFWTFVPRAKFATGVPVMSVAYAAGQFDELWGRFASRAAPRPAQDR
jgi:hypothetical protein